MKRNIRAHILMTCWLKFRNNPAHEKFNGGNGCGADFTAYIIPDKLFGLGLYPACKIYDRCYATVGKYKKDYNDEFQKDIEKECDDNVYIFGWRNKAC